MSTSLDELKTSGDAPEWMNDEGFRTLGRGYLLYGETPRMMYRRVAKACASYYADSSKWEEKFFDAMWKNWLCAASPVLSNMGTDRGLPISCNTIHVGDSVESIFSKNFELAMLSKNGAGVGIYLGDVRGRGTSIKGNGVSEGVIPWSKVYDTTTMSVNQGSTRRGASAVYLPIEHKDFDEFLRIRRPTGDVNRQCLNINQGVTITDDWMKALLAGDTEKRQRWVEILKTRVETGQPYLQFIDAANRANPACYVANGLSVKSSNICCLSADTLVLTSEGPKRIDSLVGKTVEIFDGKSWVTTDSFSQRGEDTLVRITLANGATVDSNSNHRWFAASSYDNIAKGKYREILTKDLSQGQWLESHAEEVHGTNIEPAAYLKGFLLGDGTHTKDRPTLNLHFPKFECAERLIADLNSLPITSSNTNTLTEAGFSDVQEVESEDSYGLQIFRRMEGLTARKVELLPWVTSYRERLPESIFQWNRASKLAFLAGLCDSDGTIGKSCLVQIAHATLPFLEDIRLLLRTLGTDSSIDRLSESGCFRLTISCLDIYGLLPEMGCQRLRYEGPKPNRKSTGWRRIVSIRPIDSAPVPVYCPTLPTTGKFALANGLMTGNTEIMLHTDPDHSFVCCLSSLNLLRWDEWKDTDLVNTTVRLLDAVLEEYIHKTEGIAGLEASRASAIKGRAIGIGVLGWHSLLQSRSTPFDSYESMALNAEIFRTIKTKAEDETKVLAEELGEPLWCKGFGRRNSHLIAIAPTVSNSSISGGFSAGIEPLAANVYAVKSAKGTFLRKNSFLESLLDAKGQNTPETWRSINELEGSVQHLNFLNEKEKAIYLTAREINQHALVKQAAQRQKWVDQGQSLNLFFGANSDPRYMHEVHIAAWESGLKSLYYLRTSGVIRGDLASRSKEECLACEG